MYAIRSYYEDVFAHSRVGKNVDPESKINEFEKFLDQGIGKNIDIAFSFLGKEAER